MALACWVVFRQATISSLVRSCWASKQIWTLPRLKNTTDGIDSKLTWFGTTRTRAGFLINPLLLLYGTGGVAYGRVEESVPGASVKTPGVGWAAGAGIQYALTPQWSIGAEYLHVDLDLGSANAGGASVDAKATTNLGRATLNYKF